MAHLFSNLHFISCFDFQRGVIDHMTGTGGAPVLANEGGGQTIRAIGGDLAPGHMIGVGPGLVRDLMTEVTDVLTQDHEIADRAGGLDPALIPGGVVVTGDHVIVTTKGLVLDLWMREDQGLHRRERTSRGTGTLDQRHQKRQ